MTIAIDLDLVDRLCKHFDPATHPLLADFERQMSSEEWSALTAVYGLEFKARIEFYVARRAIAERVIELGIMSRETAESNAFEHGFDEWLRKDDAYIRRRRDVGPLIDRFDNVAAWRAQNAAVFKETARRILGHDDVDEIPVPENATREEAVAILEEWSRVTEDVRAGRAVSENPLHDALIDLERLVDVSAMEGRVYEVAEMIVDF